MYRNKWRGHSCLYVLAGLMVLAAVCLASNFLTDQTQDRASIVRISGSVSIERAGSKLVPSVGMILNTSDKITTSKGSSLEVTFDDGLKDIVKIGSNSHVVLESDAIQKQTSIFMDKGEILLKLEKLEKGSNFQVRTPTAVAGVRGTSFGVQLKGKEAIISDFESKIYVKGLNQDFVENDDELLLSEGWKVKVRQFENPSRVEKITSEERTAWLSWINEVASLSVRPAGSTQHLDSSSGGASTLQGLSFNLLNCPGSLWGLILKLVSSASVMAFLLYIALMVNIRKVFV